MFCCHETDDRFQSLQLLIATFAVIINTLMMLFMGQNCQLLAVHKIFKNSIQTSSKIISFISVIGIKNSFYVRRDFFCDLFFHHIFFVIFANHFCLDKQLLIYRVNLCCLSLAFTAVNHF